MVPVKLFAAVVCAMLLFRPAVLFGRQEDLAAKSRRGAELMAAGRFEEAIPLYTELVKAVPNNPGLMTNLGMALHLAGQDRQAIRHFQTALKLQPANIPARLFLGAAYLRLGEPARAVAPLASLVRAQPENHEARAMLADALLALDRFEPAASHFERLVQGATREATSAEVTPESPRAWYGLGRSYEALARRAFEALGKIAPESGWWLALVAESRARQGQFAGAFYLYRQALAKTPSLRGLHAALADVYGKTNHPDWAKIEEEKERALAPPDCAARKAECDFQAGRFRELVVRPPGPKPSPESLYWRSRAYNELANQAFSRLVKLPPSAEGHELMAGIHRNQGRHVESASAWREALKLAPDDFRLKRELALTLHLARDHEAARALVEELLKAEPESPELNYMLGDTLLALQRADEAVPLLEKAVAGDAKLLQAHGALARAYLQVGKGERAVPHLKAALVTDSDGSLHYQLARAYQASGQTALAQQMFERYRRIRKSLAVDQRTSEAEIKLAPPE